MEKTRVKCLHMALCCAFLAAYMFASSCAFAMFFLYLIRLLPNQFETWKGDINSGGWKPDCRYRSPFAARNLKNESKESHEVSKQNRQISETKLALGADPLHTSKYIEDAKQRGWAFLVPAGSSRLIAPIYVLAHIGI